ncbi:MAG: ABC transporter permease [Desulfobulbaceae bacterium]|nr:ABC transporter permease [Desulfobulbaceae bacterium]
MSTNTALFAKPAAFIRRDFKIAASYRLQFVTQGIGIILSTFSFFLVSRMFDGQNVASLTPYGGNYFSFALIGIALTDYLTISTNSFAGEIRSAQMVGTLEALLVTPTSMSTILFSSFIFKLLATTIRIWAYLLLGVFFFGVTFPSVDLLLLAITFILTLIPFLGLGLFSAAFIIVFKQGSPISGLMAMASGLLGGVLYPVSVLPAWLIPFSSVLPITHGLEAMRRILLNGAGIQDVIGQWNILFWLSLAFMGIGCGSIYYGLKIAKKDGSLLHY